MNEITICELMALYKGKELSPVEVTIHFLNRIKEYTSLNAFITVCEEKAIKQAEIAERRFLANEETGLLEGIPISYKDNINTKGILTTSGSKIEEKFIPIDDAAIVKSLQREGAVNLGKVNLHEYAFGITSNNPFYGPVKNPWNEAFTPGGSSGGSGAAVAASLSFASIGTDTAGSIRIPAASCGVIGLKPTHRLLDMTGVKHISWTLDHLGPLTKNVDDLALMFQALTGLNNDYYLTNDIRGLRIGVPKNYFNEHLNESASSSFEKALKNFESLGAILIEVDIPFNEDDLDLSFAIGIAEAGYVHEQSIVSSLDLFGPDVRASLQTSHSISALDYIKALHRKEQITEQFERIFDIVDVLASPTIPDTSQMIGKETMTINGEKDSTFHAMTRLPAPFNLTGQPAISIPSGIAPNGLPLGLQLASQHFAEQTLIQVAYAYEQAFLTDFYKKRNEQMK